MDFNDEDYLVNINEVKASLLDEITEMWCRGNVLAEEILQEIEIADKVVALVTKLGEKVNE